MMSVEPHSVVCVLIRGRLSNATSAMRDLREGAQTGRDHGRSLPLDSHTAMYGHI